MGEWDSGLFNFWFRPLKKRVVESCWVLDLLWLARQGCLAPGREGMMPWLWFGHEIPLIYYRILHAEGEALTLLLSYPAGEDVTLPVRMETTRLHHGGRRWWGRCPIGHFGTTCGRRVAKLYLPPQGLYFGCRDCYNLTYTSCRRSHQWDGFCRRFAPGMAIDRLALKRLMERIGKRGPATNMDEQD
jgi:hypothetical protein